MSTRSVFLIGVLFSLHLVLYSCMGKIFLPSAGDTMVVAPGADVEIAWTFDNELKHVRIRWWRSPDFDTLATIFYDETVKKRINTIPGVEVKKPATLILRNVDLHLHNGTYRFYLTSQPRKNGTRITEKSEVSVFVEVKPNVTTNCSSLVALNEGDNIECLCKGEGGNPRANLTWSKDGVQIGYTMYKENMLTLGNIDKTASGTYKCLGQSHNQKAEKSVKVTVSLPPAVKRITSIPEIALYSKPVIILCDAIAVPAPSYIIVHNDTVIVSTDKTYIILALHYSHTGSYKCIAKNKLGNNTKGYNLSFHDPGKTVHTKSICGMEWYIFLTVVVSGVIVGATLSYITARSCRWLKNKEPQSNPEPETSTDDTVCQGLDLTEMNSRDNSQSMRMNSAGDDEAYEYYSTYTALNEIRDVEHNYQALI